ncbi:hypothetical protein STEPF1_00223 [Streptomyces sp. F-1]|nr:hypothetical protein STEPF1_00223 [Streptomyces sp. F-1]
MPSALQGSTQSSPRRSQRQAQRPRQPFEGQRDHRSATGKQRSKVRRRSLGRDLLWTMSDSRGRRGHRTVTDNPGRRRLILHQFPKRATTSSSSISIRRVGTPTATTPRRLPQLAHMRVRRTRRPRPSSRPCPHSPRAAPLRPRNALVQAIRFLHRPRCRTGMRSRPVSAERRQRERRCQRQRQPPRAWQWPTCPRREPFWPPGGKSRSSSGSCRRLCPDPRGPYRTSYTAWGFLLTSSGLSITCGESGTRSLTDRGVLLAQRQQRTLWRVARPWPSG